MIPCPEIVKFVTIVGEVSIPLFFSQVTRTKLVTFIRIILSKNILTKYTKTQGSPCPSNPTTPGSLALRTKDPHGRVLSSRFDGGSTSR